MCEKFVIVISLFGFDVVSNSNSRTINIIKSLQENNDCIVKYVTTDFDHKKMCIRDRICSFICSYSICSNAW